MHCLIHIFFVHFQRLIMVYLEKPQICEDSVNNSRILPARIEAKVSPDVSDTSKTTGSPNSSKNSTPSPAVPVSPKEYKEGCCALPPPPPPAPLIYGPPRSSHKMSCIPSKVRPALVDDECKQPEEIGLPKPISHCKERE
ncbi:hypothetical protein ACTXT7_009430 [Hymenolepis weldensis]